MEKLILSNEQISDEEKDILYKLANNYIRNVFNFISKLKDKIVVFDFDGTLTQFQYAENRILPCDEEDLYEYSKNNNIYDNVKIIETMQYVMSKLDPKDMYIITNSVGTIKEKKQKTIDENCKYILKENVLHTKSKEDKLEKMKEIHYKTGKKIIFVEDMATNIQLMEENTDFIQGFHISSLLS